MNMQALLEKSSIFTEALKDQMDRSREKHAAIAATTRKRAPKAKQVRRGGRSGRRVSGRAKRPRLGSDDEDDAEEEGEEALKRARVLADEPRPAFVQPALLTGAKLKDYQLEGVAWMISLWENGISGILGACAVILVSNSVNIIDLVLPSGRNGSREGGFLNNAASRMARNAQAGRSFRRPSRQSHLLPICACG